MYSHSETQHNANTVQFGRPLTIPPHALRALGTIHTKHRKISLFKNILR